MVFSLCVSLFQLNNSHTVVFAISLQVSLLQLLTMSAICFSSSLLKIRPNYLSIYFLSILQPAPLIITFYHIIQMANMFVRSCKNLISISEILLFLTNWKCSQRCIYKKRENFLKEPLFRCVYFRQRRFHKVIERSFCRNITLSNQPKFLIRK